MNADKAAIVIAELEGGKSLRKAAASVGVDPATVLRWVKADENFAQQYAQARETGYQLLADEILEISDDSSGDTVETDRGPVSNPEFTARSRLRVDSRKWMLSKMLPKVYGEKVDHNLTGTVHFSKISRQIVDPT